MLLLVTEKMIENKTVFLCDICGLGYSEENVAQDCEDYCKTHVGSCSVKITKKAAYLPDTHSFDKEKVRLFFYFFSLNFKSAFCSSFLYVSFFFHLSLF
jgi:hypothetical protein